MFRFLETFAKVFKILIQNRELDSCQVVELDELFSKIRVRDLKSACRQRGALFKNLITVSECPKNFSRSLRPKSFYRQKAC